MRPQVASQFTASPSANETEPTKAADGDATSRSVWIGAGGDDGQWLQVGFSTPVKVAEVHLHLGLQSVKGLLVEAGEIQIQEGGQWRKVGGFFGNRAEEMRVALAVPIETSSVRFWTPGKGKIAVRELAVYSQPASLGEGLAFYGEGKHVVCVNQIGYQQDYPKRFTVPTAAGKGLTFELIRNGSGEVLHTGELKDGVGDFSKWNPPSGKNENIVIRVEGGGMEPGESFPFLVQDKLYARSLLQPMIDFMIDARSIVGSHPSAFGGAAWRDGSYYTHELASLVTLYMAYPREVESLSRQIDWEAEKRRILDPQFALVETRGDIGMLQAARDYYQRFEAPAADAPDVVKLIHWGCGMAIAKPKIFDPSGDGIGLQVHSQLVEQVAYVLAFKPRLEKWLPPSFFDETKRFADEHWGKTALLKVPANWNPKFYTSVDNPKLQVHAGPLLKPYKGRDTPGHSILPNLLMYEVSNREGSARAIDYLTAAVKQADFVIREMDWKDPRHTKGQRMSEHKMITGLVWLQQNYPDHAPRNLKKKLEEWADVAISRSDNLWDFRRYDMGDHWTIPVMNEPGNLGSFPACALSVSWVVEDPVKKQRLREIAVAALDCLFGRNPINSASPHHPELGWGGLLEKGWPVGFPDGTTARLETCRGALSSGPGTEMFPFKPEGKPRFPEGWSAFNAALNVGLAYIAFDQDSRAGLPQDCLKQEKR